MGCELGTFTAITPTWKNEEKSYKNLASFPPPQNPNLGCRGNASIYMKLVSAQFVRRLATWKKSTNNANITVSADAALSPLFITSVKKCQQNMPSTRASFLTEDTKTDSFQSFHPMSDFNSCRMLTTIHSGAGEHLVSSSLCVAWLWCGRAVVGFSATVQSGKPRHCEVVCQMAVAPRTGEGLV